MPKITGNQTFAYKSPNRRSFHHPHVEHICFASVCCLVIPSSLGRSPVSPAHLRFSFRDFGLRSFTSGSTAAKHISGSAMSGQINADLGVDPEAPCPACRLSDRITTPITGLSRFCYHLIYWRITRTCRTHTVRPPCMTTVLVSEVVIRLTGLSQ